MKSFAREDLQIIRETALTQAALEDQPYLVAAAFKQLAHAADRLDAMLARQQLGETTIPVLGGDADGGCGCGH